MKLPIFLLLPALMSVAGSWTIDNYGRIANFIWPEDSQDLPNFKSREDVTFISSYFENFSRSIGDQLTNMTKLQFIDGSVLQVYLKHSIHELNVYNSRTENLEIDPNNDYAIAELTVSECELTSIPTNINRLRRLTYLCLHYNKIDHVKMSDFNGLDNLEVLWLQHNGMKTLSSEATIHLPNLRELSLSNNDLQEINVCSWDMPNLKNLNFNENKLKFIVNLVDQFPKLRSISAYDNLLVCQWWNGLEGLLKSKNISGYFWDVPCNATDETHVPTTCL